MAKKMHIYLKKSEDLTKEIVINLRNAEWCRETLSGRTVFNYQTNPYLEVTEDFDLINEDRSLVKPLFLKATTISFPKFDKLIGQSTLCRSYGTYHFGKATAELTPANNDNDEKARYWLKIETNEWEGIADMKELQKRLWAGTIAPTILYDREQKLQHPLQILNQVLSIHKLSAVKRFFLALRLTKAS